MMPEIAIANSKRKITYDVVDGCWICTSHNSRDMRGYPQFRFDSKTMPVFKWVYLQSNILKEKHYLYNTCGKYDCINPAHYVAKRQYKPCYHIPQGTGKPHNHNHLVNNHFASILSKEQVLDIYNSDLSTKELQEIYSVGRGVIRRIKTGKSFVWLTGDAE